MTLSRLAPRHQVLLVLVVVSVLLAAGCASLVQASIESLMKDGLDLLAAGRFDEAIAKFTEVVRRDPAYWNAYLGLARGYIGKQSWAEAITNGRKALQLAPESQEVTTALASALLGGGVDALKKGQLSEAIGHLTDYVKLQPADVSAWVDLGKAYWQSGQLSNALSAFNHVLELSPGNSEALNFLGGMRR